MSNDLRIDKALIDSVDGMRRAERQTLLARVAEKHGVQAIADLLCERVNLVHIWLCKDPRTIPASKLKVLLRSLSK